MPKHRHTAAARNRVKRRLRELLRLDVLPRLDGCAMVVDVLVRARAEAYGASFGELQAELAGWAEQRCSRASSSA